MDISNPGAEWDVIAALQDGDLSPLRDYLLAGGLGRGALPLMLANAVDGLGPVRLRTERMTPDRGLNSDHEARYYRDLEIGVWIEKRRRQFPDESKKVSNSLAAEHFSVGDSTVRKAHKNLLRQLAGDYSGFQVVDLVALNEAFPGRWRDQ